MALSLSGISSGRVDEGDTKTLSATPDATPSTLVAVFTPPSGSADTYAIGDFTESGGVYSLSHTFDVAGRWHVKVTATDASGHSEVEDGYVYVHPVP
jgi:hypothetical protein